ncbi:exodeoxyribonuclease VII small subunit [Thermoflavifilum thermophilum]|uniref:Exodeoxyribonuclease 7 small subunit n=1 Tax=Thermoflavifilum thermophilum TaxID=1393122 RepID=A0A1I7N2W5_9BACT|nr:exodeoxyribonuclease VII small subunit [Thermoflavifilum thermophilum]SFV28896.1 Exodeoxyribonuclease VII small subunit [Thermoflavifilum thermophilum]
MSEEITYTQAFEELQQIVGLIERGEITIDELSAKVKRAAFLIRICRQKLAETEQDIEEVLKSIDEDKKLSSADDQIQTENEDLPF